MRFENRLTELLKIETLRDDAKSKNGPDFFGSAVIAAKLSQKETRLKIISDMAEALDCGAEELMFLFEDLPLNDNNAQTDFPSFRRALGLEAAE